MAGRRDRVLCTPEGASNRSFESFWRVTSELLPFVFPKIGFSSALKPVKATEPLSSTDQISSKLHFLIKGRGPGRTKSCNSLD